MTDLGEVPEVHMPALVEDRSISDGPDRRSGVAEPPVVDAMVEAPSAWAVWRCGTVSRIEGVTPLNGRGGGRISDAERGEDCGRRTAHQDAASGHAVCNQIVHSKLPGLSADLYAAHSPTVSRSRSLAKMVSIVVEPARLTAMYEPSISPASPAAV